MKHWRALCHISEIAEDQSKGFEVDGQAVFAVRKHGQLYVYHNTCPHLGINLEWQDDQFLDLDHQLIQCAMHGALFLIESGQCIAGPCQGQSLTVVEHRLVQQMLEIKLTHG